MKKIAYLLAILLGLWHVMAGFAIPMIAIGGASADAREHWSLHWAEKGHHHDDHGEFHVDDSVQSALHLAFDGVNSSAVDVAFKFVQFPRMQSAEISTPIKKSWATNWPDGVFRPPRSIS